MLSYSIFAVGQTQQIKRLDGSKIHTQEVDQIVTGLMEKAKVTGLGLSIINNNKTVYTKTYGFRDKGRNQLMDNQTILH